MIRSGLSPMWLPPCSLFGQPRLKPICFGRQGGARGGCGGPLCRVKVRHQQRFQWRDVVKTILLNARGGEVLGGKWVASCRLSRKHQKIRLSGGVSIVARHGGLVGALSHLTPSFTSAFLQASCRSTAEVRFVNPLRLQSSSDPRLISRVSFGAKQCLTTPGVWPRQAPHGCSAVRQPLAGRPKLKPMGGKYLRTQSVNSGGGGIGYPNHCFVGFEGEPCTVFTRDRRSYRILYRMVCLETNQLLNSEKVMWPR